MLNKEFLNSIVNSLKDESKEGPRSKNDKVLLVDSFNTFLRGFAANKQINLDGIHIGGLVTFIKSLGAAITKINPTRIILVFDGTGSTNNKKLLYPDYKGNRNLTRITKWDAFDSLAEEKNGVENQMLRLIEYLQTLPIDLISIDKIEADDVIGYLCKHLPNKVVILSSDKDFFQLVSDIVTLYDATKKQFFTPELVKETTGIYPYNFINYKILMGDNSDNVPGVRGLGEKKLLKLFPEIYSETNIKFQEILELCKNRINENKLYKTILDVKPQLDINSQLMDLSDPILMDSDEEIIQQVIQNPNTNFYKNLFVKMYKEDLLGNSISNLDFWLENNFKKYTIK